MTLFRSSPVQWLYTAIHTVRNRHLSKPLPPHSNRRYVTTHSWWWMESLPQTSTKGSWGTAGLWLPAPVWPRRINCGRRSSLTGRLRCVYCWGQHRPTCVWVWFPVYRNGMQPTRNGMEAYSTSISGDWGNGLMLSLMTIYRPGKGHVQIYIHQTFRASKGQHPKTVNIASDRIFMNT